MIKSDWNTQPELITVCCCHHQFTYMRNSFKIHLILQKGPTQTVIFTSCKPSLYIFFCCCFVLLVCSFFPLCCFGCSRFSDAVQWKWFQAKISQHMRIDVGCWWRQNEVANIKLNERDKETRWWWWQQQHQRKNRDRHNMLTLDGNNGCWIYQLAASAHTMTDE